LFFSGTFICCTIEDHTKRPSAHDVTLSLKAIIKDFNINELDGSIIKTDNAKNGLENSKSSVTKMEPVVEEKTIVSGKENVAT